MRKYAYINSFDFTITLRKIIVMEKSNALVCFFSQIISLSRIFITALVIISYSTAVLGDDIAPKVCCKTIVKFTANCKVGKVSLKWSTNLEINNANFYVYCSPDMINWQQLVQIPGAGNNTSPKVYNAVHEYPLPGVSYYRLIQEDYDGKRESFDAISVNCINSNSEAEVQVYPNPASGWFMVSLNLPDTEETTGEIQIADLNGRVLGTRELQISTGKTHYTYNDEKLNAGIYMMRVVTSDWVSQPVKLFVR